MYKLKKYLLKNDKIELRRMDTKELIANLII